MIFVGVEWAHHDICVLDEAGAVLVKKRIPDSLEDVRSLHGLLGAHAEEPETVLFGIEKDQGVLVTAPDDGVVSSFFRERGLDRPGPR